MKKLLLSILAVFCFVSVSAETTPPKDTLYTELKSDIVILSSTKETNSLRSLPASVSVFSPKNLESMQVHNIKDLSAFVPNYFVADYGSKMTAPLYIRGIGARSGTQTASLYIDNVPYFNTTSFDSELFDIQRVEVLRGTQGTLYGRNAMGGILNIYTYSPLSYEGTKVKVGGGNYGFLSGDISHYRKLNNTMGVSVAAYYRKDDGYFKNIYTGNKVDDMKNVGGRAKFAWNVTPRLSANYSVSFDYVDQGAFPYANTETNEISYNSEGYYKRKLLTNGLSLRYAGNGYEINSTTGYQYLHDEMNMDQDYTPLSMFQINQKQKQNSLSQEITIKSDNASDYQWSGGVYGFYDYLHTTPPVYMMKDGVKYILQPSVDKGLEEAATHVPPYVTFPKIDFTDETIAMDGNYKRPAYGAAVFHQSTFNNIFDTKGLSFTMGLRLDYEKTKLDYDASTIANYNSTNTKTNVVTPFAADTAIVNRASDEFLELLPKAVLKYDINKKSYIYVSASRGYKTGGHNIQVFADLLQDALQQRMMNQIMDGMVASIPPAVLPMIPEDVLNRLKNHPQQEDVDINGRISYKPEYSWNYELGGQISIIDNTLSTNFALYYIDVKDVQITKFVKSLGGRMVTNAGKAVSKGFEVGLKARPCSGFYLYSNYGFTDARFKDYKTEDEDGNTLDYSDNYIPFAPRFTFSVGGNVSYDMKRCTIIDRVTFDANFAQIGRVHWTEANDMYEKSYNTVDARLAFDKSIFTVELWGKNIFDTEYNSFLFESSGNHFAQQGKPARWGASLKMQF